MHCPVCVTASQTPQILRDTSDSQAGELASIVMWTKRNRRVVLAVGAGLAVVTAAAVFQPWLLWTDVNVNDEIPVVSTSEETRTDEQPNTSDRRSEETRTPSAPADADEAAEATSAADAGPRVVSEGSLVSHEHETTGTARIVTQADGSRLLVLESLATTSGPDVHVWLSAGPVVEGGDGWYTAGSYDFIDLGPIKGNLGDQVYPIPADVDLAAFPTVDLWCVQFGVSFGAAALLPT